MVTAYNERDLAAMVRASDYARFLAIQLAPAAQRLPLYAVTEFAAELRRITHTASEPLTGFIRFAWWREALEEMTEGKAPRHHPLLMALTPQPALLRLIEMQQHALEAEGDSSWEQKADEALDEAWKHVCHTTHTGKAGPLRALEIMRNRSENASLPKRPSPRLILRLLWFSMVGR